MDEKQLFRKVIEDSLLSKEDLRRRVIGTAPRQTEGGSYMKKKIAAAAAAFVLIATMSLTAYAAVDAYEYNQAEGFLGGLGIQANELSRSDAKKVYKDIKSDDFSYPVTIDVLTARAMEIGIEVIPADAKALYNELIEFNSHVYTAQISSDGVRMIKSGMSYREITEILGSTKDIGSGMYVLQYVVDGDKILYLSFGSIDDICTMSGDELLESLVDAGQDNEDLNTFNGTLMQRTGNGILVTCPTFRSFDMISLAINEDTVIEFSDGSRASAEDIRGELTITITGPIAESYPPQAVAAKIVIRN